MKPAVAEPSVKPELCECAAANVMVHVPVAAPVQLVAAIFTTSGEPVPAMRSVWVVW